MPKRLALLLFIALVWCCFNNTPAYCLANETDRLALISFKGSIDQDPFGALTSWNDSLHYCDWEGITCSRLDVYCWLLDYGMGDRTSTDMYSYGILLLEMFTGKRPTDNMFKDTMSLHNFVESALPNQVMEIVDPCIRSEHGPRSWFKETIVSVLRIGVACSMESPRDRMQIQTVVSEICKIKDVYENHALSQSQHLENTV